ncbi:oxidoreductase, partial [Streptomyces sp. DSM 41640]|nr:oxidoreductase [Streptomyces sp. DSM 41640]
MMAAANRVFASDPSFGARQTLFAASQDVPGDSFIGPRFGQFVPSQPVGRSPLAKRVGTQKA